MVLNSPIMFSSVLDCVNRLSFTHLKVKKLVLDSPVNLLNCIYDKLINDSSVYSVQISGEVLLFARKRYLYENFSLAELKKCLIFALANYVHSCERDTLHMLSVCHFLIIHILDFLIIFLCVMLF